VRVSTVVWLDYSRTRVRRAWSTFERRRREYGERFSSPHYAHLEVVRLSSPGDARRWLRSVLD